MSRFQIRLPEAHHVTDEGKPYWTYQIEVTDGINVQSSRQRYNQFDALNDHLRKKFRTAKLPKLPGKRLMGNDDPVFVEERRKDLEQYMTAIPLVGDETISFFGLKPGDAPVPYRERPPSEWPETLSLAVEEAKEAVRTGSGNVFASMPNFGALLEGRNSGRAATAVAAPLQTAEPPKLVRALYDLVGDGDDKLSFNTGDIITLLDKTDLHDKFAYFPSSFVEDVVDESSTSTEQALAEPAAKPVAEEAVSPEVTPAPATAIASQQAFAAELSRNVAKGARPNLIKPLPRPPSKMEATSTPLVQLEVSDTPATEYPEEAAVESPEQLQPPAVTSSPVVSRAGGPPMRVAPRLPLGSAPEPTSSLIEASQSQTQTSQPLASSPANVVVLPRVLPRPLKPGALATSTPSTTSGENRSPRKSPIRVMPREYSPQRGPSATESVGSPREGMGSPPNNFLARNRSPQRGTESCGTDLPPPPPAVTAPPRSRSPLPSRGEISAAVAALPPPVLPVINKSPIRQLPSDPGLSSPLVAPNRSPIRQLPSVDGAPMLVRPAPPPRDLEEPRPRPQPPPRDDIVKSPVRRIVIPLIAKQPIKSPRTTAATPIEDAAATTSPPVTPSSSAFNLFIPAIRSPSPTPLATNATNQLPPSSTPLSISSIPTAAVLSPPAQSNLHSISPSASLPTLPSVTPAPLTLPASPGPAVVPDTANATTREKIAQEILSTETFFVQCMEKLVTYFLHPLRDAASKGMDGLTQGDLRTVFSNAELIWNCNREFLSDLSKRFPWTPSSCIGDVVLRFIPFFKLYKEYGANYDAALAHSNQLNEGNRTYGSLVASNNQRLKTERINFESLLIMPVQRVPRYSLLLQDLIKHTADSHPDLQSLKAALVKTKELADFLNTGIKSDANARELTQMATKIQGLEALLAPHRKLLRNGVLGVGKKQKPTRFFLFNDMIVVGSGAGASNISVKSQWDLKLTWLSSATSDQKGLASWFELRCPEGLFSVWAESAQEKKLWLDDIRSAFKAYPEGSVDENVTNRVGAHDFAGRGMYTGQWEVGAMQGRGDMTFVGGNKYEGEWRGGKQHGIGVLTFFNNDRYEGNFAEDHPEGNGTLTYGNGDIYVGCFQAGKRSLRGVMKYANGEVYNGEWKSDQINGRGNLLYKSGAYYDGLWKDNKRSGKGMQGSTDKKEVYDGEWKDDRRDGKGVQQYANGSTYDGMWRDNRKQGTGTLKQADGSRYEGEFSEGKRTGKGSLIRYDGGWKDDKPHGFGALTADVRRYEGEWREGRKHGRGVFFSRQMNGEIAEKFEGQWSDDRPHGTCIHRFKNGCVLEGKYAMGRRDGRFSLSPSVPNNPTVRGEAKDNILFVSDDLALSLPCEPTFLNFEMLLRES